MNPRMRVFAILVCCLLAVPNSLPANNVFVLFDGLIENTVQVFTANPTAAAGTYLSGQAPVDEIAAAPDGTRYFTTADTNFDGLVQTNASFSVVDRSGDWNDAPSDLAITPDGRYALIAAGVIRIIDTATGTQVATAPAGNTPNSVAVSIDSEYALAMSSISQRLYRINLTTFTVDGELEITGQSSGVVAGPDSLFYVGATNKLVIVDGETMEEVGRISVNGVPDRMHFTPDGRYGIASNGQVVTGTTMWIFDLLNRSVRSTVGPLGDQVRRIRFDPRLAVVSNERVLATAVNATVIYDISIPDSNLDLFEPSGGSAADDVSAIVKSGEMPQARYLFYAEGLSIRRVDLSNDNLTGSPPAALADVQGLRYAGPSSIATPVNSILYNDNQVLGDEGEFRPLVVRALDVNGVPVFNATVQVSGPEGVIITDAMSRTNKDGLAKIMVDPGDVTGPIPVNVTIGGSLLATFNLAKGSGGGGGPLGGISIYSGQGQLIGDQFFGLAEPMVVRVLNTAGEPVNGATVSWAIVSGRGVIGNTTTETNAEGLASTFFAPDLIDPGGSFHATTITASYQGQEVRFYQTAFPTNRLDGQPAAPPDAILVAPLFSQRDIVAQTGTVLEDAVRILVTAAEGVFSGDPIPNVALDVSTGDDPTMEPYARCVGEGDVALTGADGIASCNLQVMGTVGGPVPLVVQIGGNFVSFPGFTLTTTPGGPAEVSITSGNPQAGNPGQTLGVPLGVEVKDGAGNRLGNVAVTWTVVEPGSVTLTNVGRVTDGNGRAQATAILGTNAGTFEVRVTAGTGSATFSLTVDIAITGLNAVSGSNQTAVAGQPFAQPLVVRLLEEDGSGAQGQQINFNVTSGSAVLSSGTATTGANGQAQVNVTAGNAPGPVTVSASFGSLPPVTFTLNVRLPGPNIDGSSFSNGAGGQIGLVAGSVAIVRGTGLAPNVQNCVVPHAQGALPLELANVTIEFPGPVFAPLFYVCNEGGVQSVAFQAPWQLTPGTTSVTVRVQGGATTVDNVTVLPYQPGIFETIGGSGLRHGVAMRPDGSYVTETNPARPGEVICMFATGLGAISPPSGTNFGGIAGQSVLADVVVGVNNQGVRVLAAEYAVNLIGLYVVYFEVPADSPAGLLPLALAIRTPDGGLLFSNGSALPVQ